MSIFKNEWKEAFLQSQQEVRELRKALKRVETKLAITSNVYSKHLALSGLEFAEVARKQADEEIKRELEEPTHE